MATISFSQVSEQRLNRLLYMEYTLRELAGELGCDLRLLRRAIEAGCPHRRTDGGRVYVVGEALRDWYAEQKARRRSPLGADEAFCVRCRKSVPLRDPAFVRTKTGGRLEGVCPECGCVVNRFVSEAPR